MGERFESGQRWKAQDGERAVLVERGQYETGGYRWSTTDGDHWHEDFLDEACTLEAPAPRHGQRWVSDGRSDAWIYADDGVLTAVAFVDHERCTGSAAFMAAWLMDNGYKNVAISSHGDADPQQGPTPAEFSEKDVRDGLRVDSRASSCGRERGRLAADGAGEWRVWSESYSRFVGRVTTSDVVDLVRRGSWVPLREPDGQSAPVPPTQRSGRRFDGVEFACQRTNVSGRAVWDSASGCYEVGCGAWLYYDREIQSNLDNGLWRIVSGPQPDAPKDQPPRFAQPRFAINALWSQLPPFPHHVPDHVHPSAEGIAMFERSLADKPVSPREASRRAIDDAVRGLRGQPFAAAIQAVLVAACTEGRSGERILSRDDITSMVAACRAWEDCRGKVAPGRRTLTPEQQAACWEAANKAGLWLGGSGEVYEWARSL